MASSHMLASRYDIQVDMPPGQLLQQIRTKAADFRYNGIQA